MCNREQTRRGSYRELNGSQKGQVCYNWICLSEGMGGGTRRSFDFERERGEVCWEILNVYRLGLLSMEFRKMKNKHFCQMNKENAA